MSDIKYTIFTPTYNRSKYLNAVRKSVLAQKRSDIEWIIVDDGSTDETRNLIESWDLDALNVVYVYQENSGKHIAYNTMVSLARGKYIICIDSDDELMPNTVNLFEEIWDSISSDVKPQLCGIVGLRAFKNGKIIGDKFPIIKTPIPSYELTEKYNVKGDKFGIMKLSVLKDFPFPSDLGRFISEGIVWNEIALHYSQYPVNEVFSVCEYQEGGLSDRLLPNRIKSIDGTLRYYYTLLKAKRSINTSYLVKYCINYGRFILHSGSPPFNDIKNIPISRVFTLITLLPISFCFYIKDKCNLR
ncbi:glycosyltransferase family 2 protein [Aliivibrio finisterrensis]|uniref:Glycosyltransferase family 2 protein n=1 Tax=Aliivibrio finisterrensis TaxID=511998 RepID=A0A4Q5KFG3_9GAMM|nr:glycosyltransferase family 2 protein [Aliivibrio finisterrensis]RYU44043.1 glycosyltransferase family 2 protein [Aliivibrio finisterrensis]